MKTLSTLLAGVIIGLVVGILLPLAHAQTSAGQIVTPAATLTVTTSWVSVPGNYDHVTIINNSATAIYAGGRGTTTATGDPICTNTVTCPEGPVRHYEVAGPSLGLIAGGAVAGVRYFTIR